MAMTSEQLIKKLQDGIYDQRLEEIYKDEKTVSYQRQRYIYVVSAFDAVFGNGQVQVFSVPGRCEIGGNHTDHQNGEVLAASVDIDIIAAAAPGDGMMMRLMSEGYHKLNIDLEDLDMRQDETGSSAAIVRGVAAGFAARGYNIGGIDTYMISDIPEGAGLSSSAAFEMMIGMMFNEIYNNGEISSIEIAEICKEAENKYFGKPCGLMDQLACGLGGLVHIDFADKERPCVTQIGCDVNSYGHIMYITDTGGSHQDLTDEYAAVTSEMKQVAEHFGQDALQGITWEQLLNDNMKIREAAGDRAFLRAVHFVEENKRVRQEADALKNGDFKAFLKLVKESGDSSFKYLQNVFIGSRPAEQNISVALAVSEKLLEAEGACRVHGGGFAGTIQAFVPHDKATEYHNTMETVFGAGSCKALAIRKVGSIRVF